ncbi:MAG: ATP-binding protein, partial [Deltaproteobacteria bacterium]|nr:ATP-binding protein [Deltaproteobacteria bacterium]
HFLWTKTKWIIAAWFAVAFIGAASTRGKLRLKSNTRIRIRSIWIIASWVLVAGLGLSITEDLVGKGTIYAWVWIFLKLLALPMLLLLIRWWRPEIYRGLEEASQPPAYVQKILQHKQGLGSFLGAAFGAIYLIVNGFRQWVLRVVSAFEGGRYLIANLTRLEAVRVSERMSQKIEGDPISDEMRHRLYADDGGLVESVGHDCLERMIHLVEQGRKGTAAIVAEQGGGKTHLLKRLGSRFEGKMILFECPPGGADAFQRNFAESLGLNASDLTTEAISGRLQERQISVIGVDNLHRLSRPAFGGQRDMDQVDGLVSPVKADVFWFYGVNWAAWHYISRVRKRQLFLDDVLRIPLWTEEQIRKLIELRSAHADIEPDFGELILPRQFESIDYDTVEDRNRFGFYRILWNASDGNPMVSLQLWADSLRIAPDGRILVSLPQLPATSELEKVNMTLLLVLRVIAQSEMANQEEIADSLRFPATEVAGALNLAITHEWVEQVNGRYHLTGKWFRSITRVLARKNLLVRKALVGG